MPFHKVNIVFPGNSGFMQSFDKYIYKSFSVRKHMPKLKYFEIYFLVFWQVKIVPDVPDVL